MTTHTRIGSRVYAVKIDGEHVGTVIHNPRTLRKRSADRWEVLSDDHNVWHTFRTMGLCLEYLEVAHASMYHGMAA